MARRWSAIEEEVHRSLLRRLYIDQNLTISEVGMRLGIAEQTVYQRLVRLGIRSSRDKKPRANNRRTDVHLPVSVSVELAELVGILLGDGHLSHYQLTVTLGTKELGYARHATHLIKQVFGGTPRISRNRLGHITVYLGSTEVTGWLIARGLVCHKTRSQADIPTWVLDTPHHARAFVRGFFDTDGSVYALRHGIQISFTNASRQLLTSLRTVLKGLGYTPSAISARTVYLTKATDVRRFFGEVRPANSKHRSRYASFAPVV